MDLASTKKFIEQIGECSLYDQTYFNQLFSLALPNERKDTIRCFLTVDSTKESEEDYAELA